MGLLEEAQLPLLNPAGSKRRKKSCSTQLEQRAQTKNIDLIRPDSERFLASTGRPSTRWCWD